MAGFNAFLKNNNIITGTAIPTEGNFKTGDIIVNVGPNSATEPMWICNEGGNPGIWGPVGVGSGSIVSINSSVLINEPTNEISLASLGVGVSSKDKLLVHYNSTHLLEGVHFEISNDGSKIVKLGEGNWNPDGLENCIFALELFKGVESIDGDKIVVDSKMTCKTNHVVIENACGEVEIGIEGFNAGNDMMLVFKNGVNMVEGVDYEVQGSTIVSTGEVWNENGIEDYGMTFVVFKEVVEYNGDMNNGVIKLEHLSENIRTAIENAGLKEEEVIGLLDELEEELISKIDKVKSDLQTEIDSDVNVEKERAMAKEGELQNAINGKSDSGHTHKYAGSASEGGAANTALACTGNANTATTLQNSRTINGTSFNGSANITTANWGTARNITIGNKSLSVNGSGNVTYSLGDIGAASVTDINIIKSALMQIDYGEIKQIACGYRHTFILKNDGSVWSCGYNSNGQLGLNNTTDTNTFTKVTTNINNDVKQIACGYEYTYILKNDGSLWSCGKNNYGQLGLGNTTNKSTFTQVTTNINNDVKQIACGTYHIFIIKNDGSVWSCGHNTYGQLGLNDTTDKTTFTQSFKTISLTVTFD